MRGLARRVFDRRWSWLPMVVSLTLLTFLAWKSKLTMQMTASLFYQANWAILTGTLIFSAAWHLGFGAHKWWRILCAQGAQVSYREVLCVRIGADPIRFVAPMQLGALVSSVYFGKLDTLGFSRAAGSVLFDKVLELFGAVFWLYVGLAIVADVSVTWELAVHTTVGGSVLAMIGCRSLRRAILFVAESLHSKVGRLASGVLSVFEELSPIKKTGFLLYGIAFQLRPLAVCAFLFMAFPATAANLPSPKQFLANGSVVAVMSNVPSMGGVGPREAAVTEMFKGFADKPALLILGVSMSFALQLFPAILGVPLMFRLLRSITPEGRPTPAKLPLHVDVNSQEEST